MTETSAIRAELTVRGVIHPGAVVGLDDSDTVRDLLVEIVGCRPSLVGTASLTTLAALARSAPARAGDLRVRLFGGDFQPTGVCTGGQSVKAVTATRCDVAVVAGSVVGDDVWVRSTSRPGRLALLLAARRAYLVPEPIGAYGGGWARLGAVRDFDGVVTATRPAEPAAA